MQEEQSKFREQIRHTIEENQKLNKKLESLKHSTTLSSVNGNSETRDDATRDRYGLEAFKNAKKQLDFLQTENNELKSLNKSSQKIIRNLEYEIQNYRNQLFKTSNPLEAKQKYTNTIKVLETTVRARSKDIEILTGENQKLHEKIVTLEAKIKEKDHDISGNASKIAHYEKLQKRFSESNKQIKELEKQIKLSNRIIEERIQREQIALQKVQEALDVAGAAVADKEEAQKREKVVKEECDNLAATIGQVMDEAAQKVEKDMEALRKKFSEKERLLKEEQEKIKDELQNQTKYNQILETRSCRFEHKYKETLKDNLQLKQELQAATKTLDDLELKLELSKSSVGVEESTERRTQDHDKQIQHYIQTNKHIKEKYRMIIEDITKKFEKQIYRLQNENANLRAEIQVSKLQTNYTSDD